MEFQPRDTRGILHINVSGQNQKVVRFKFLLDNSTIDYYKNRNYPVIVENLEYSDPGYSLYSNIGSIMFMYNKGRNIATESGTVSTTG